MGFLLAPLVLIAAFFFASATSDAAERQREALLEEMVVTATKTEQPLDAVPARVEVITKEDIQKISSATTKVDEILQYVAGLTVVRGSGVYSLGASATLRGLSNEGARTLVLIDGVPINKSDTGEVNFNRINVKDIERIEIFKGPASSLFGNNAMGGVINIITSKPDKPAKGSVSGFYGTYNTYGGDADIYARLSPDNRGFFFSASGHYLNGDGYISTPEEKRNAYTVKRFAEEMIAGLSMGYDFDKTNSIVFKIDRFDDKRGEGVKIRADDGVSRDFDTWAYSLSYKGSSGNMMWQTKAFWQNENYRRISERQSGATYTRFDVDSDRTDMGIDGSFSVQIHPNHLITVGGDIRRGKIDGSDIYKTSPDRANNRGNITIAGLWIQDEISALNGAMHISANLRFDHARFDDGYFYSTMPPLNKLNGDLASASWNALTPRVSAKYKWSPEFSTYASYGRGFRASILDDLCRSGIIWGIRKVANPSLEPEKLESFEAGADYSPVKGMRFSSSFYYSIGKDFLYYIPTGQSLDGQPLYRRENIGRVISYGAEIGSQYKLGKDLSAFLNYTYNRAYIDEYAPNRAIEGQELTRTPKNQVKGGVTWLNPYVNASLFGIYKSSQYIYTNEVRQTVSKVDSYVTIGAKLWREIVRGMTLSVSADNLFDERYTESANEMAPGLTIMATLSYAF